MPPRLNRRTSLRATSRSPWGRWLLLGGVVGAVALLMVLLVVPVPRPRGLVEPEELADEDSRFVEVDGIRLHYKDQGDPSAKRTIVFLHGFASSVYMWRHAMVALCGRYRVIAFDRPGFGLSGRPLAGDWQGDSPYSTSAAARQTVALMDALGIDRAVLVGHSQGATISVLVDEMRPERVSAMVLVNCPTAAKRFRGVPPGIVRRLRRLPYMRLAPLLPRPFFGRNARTVMGLAYHDPSKLTEETIELELKATRVKDWDLSYVELAPIQVNLRVPRAMAAVTAPTLVVAGENDPTVPYRDQVRAARSIPGARLVTFAATGHVIPEERPKAFAEVVADFVNKLES